MDGETAGRVGRVLIVVDKSLCLLYGASTPTSEIAA